MGLCKTVFVGLLVAWLVACAQSEPTATVALFRGAVLGEPIAAADFELQDQHGQTFRLSEQRGKVVVLFFGYTSCPDVCPTTLGAWKRAYEELGEQAGEARFVFITVDPERDTPARLQTHLELFNPAFIGLTGTLEELEPIYQAYGVYHEKQAAPESALGYLVSHTSSDYVIDKAGNWRLRHAFGASGQDIAHDIRVLLGE
jgi:protein SCO1/2